MKMNAYEVRRPGGPEVLELLEKPIPEPAAGEVLLRVAAVGVNHHDVRERKRHDPSKSPELPGLEASGEVVAVGTGVSSWKVGDRVCALLNAGGYAEYCTAPQEQCLPVPGGMSLVDAASLPETYFTVWSNVFQIGRLAPGETLLAHGGAGGIGVTAIQLAKAFGNPVFVTEGSVARCKACLSLGADLAIDYREQDFVDVVRGRTGGRGVDVILDIIGGTNVARGVRALADDGRIVMLAYPGGPTAELDLREIGRRRLTVTGSALKPRPLAHKRLIAQELRTKVWPLFDNGRLKAVVHAVVPFERAAEAHRLMEEVQHVGKIVLTLQ